MNSLAQSSGYNGYSQKVRVNYHEVSPKNDQNASQASIVKFVSQHKSHPGLKAILSLSISAIESPSVAKLEESTRAHFFSQDQSRILKIESLQVFDSREKITDVSDEVLQQLLSSILQATFEYGNSHSIREWLVPVKPEFDADLNKIGLPHNRYSFDEKGRCIIGVRPREFLCKGKQLIDSWTRRLFEVNPVLN